MRSGAASESGERQRSACAPGAAQDEANECTSSAVGWTTSRYFARNRVSILNQAISCLQVRGSCSEEAVWRPRRVTGGGGGSGAPGLSFVREGDALAARAGGAGGSAWAHWRSNLTVTKSLQGHVEGKYDSSAALRNNFPQSKSDPRNTSDHSGSPSHLACSAEHSGSLHHIQRSEPALHLRITSDHSG